MTVQALFPYFTSTTVMDVHKRYPLAVGLPILSSLSIAVGIPPLILLAKNRNYPAASLISWSILLNLFNIINALCWPTDDVGSWWDGSGLCDIEVKFMVAGYLGVPGSLLCIFRSLAIVLDTDRATLVPSKSQRWRKRFVEILFCVIVPLVAMVTHIAYQKSRYYLYAISGCVSNYDESWVSLALAYIWPPIICIIAAYYCRKQPSPIPSSPKRNPALTPTVLVLIRVRRYRNDFANILRASSSNLSKSRFLRLFFLALSMLVCILPLQGFVLYYDITLALPWHPYAWSRVHADDWSSIIKVPAAGHVFFDRWTPVASGFMIFIFFGFGRDATRMYRTIFWYLGLGYCFAGIEPPSSTHDSVPSPRAESGTTLVGSISSRAKSLFSRSNGTLVARASTYHDIEKGIWSTRVRPDSRPVSRWNWLSSLSGRRPSAADLGTPLHDLSVDKTIHTNAWASQRRSGDYSPGPVSPVRTKDFIHVRQVITQQSEVQVEV